MDQKQQRRVDDTCTKMLEIPTVNSRRVCRRIVTGADEVWWVFYRNTVNRENAWIKPTTQPTKVQLVAKQDRFVQKVVMLCV